MLNFLCIKSKFNQPNALFNVLLASLLAISLSACNKNKPEEKNGQTIVRVNADEITVHQLNYQLQHANVNVKDQDAASKQILAGLVDRQILVQQALSAQLDRNPQVIQVIQDSKEQILARAYIEGKVATVPKPTETEVLEYRTKNPNIFENRKLYAMEELSFVLDASLKGELETLSNAAKTLEEVTAWLDGKQIKYARNKAVHAAETLPELLINQFSALKNGELIFINSPNKVLVGKLLESKTQPISVEDSKPIIERIIVAQKQKKAAEDEMVRLRGLAKIVYLNQQFDPKNQTKPIAAPAPSNEAEKVEPAPKIERHIEKGLSGL